LTPIKFEITVERIRQIGSRGNIQHMSSDKAQAFMTLYRDELEGTLTTALCNFINEKLHGSLE